MPFEKREINRFDGYNANLAPEVLSDELGTARDIQNLRCEKLGKLVTRNGYRITPYGEKDKARFPDADYLYQRNGGIIGLGEFCQSHVLSDRTDRYLVTYIRTVSSHSTEEILGARESEDIRKFPQLKNTAHIAADREHLAAFIFSPVVPGSEGNTYISRGILNNGVDSADLWYSGQKHYECDLNPQDGGSYKKLYAATRDLSVTTNNLGVSVNNIGHRTFVTNNYFTPSDGIDKRYASFTQYRNKLIVSDKLNGDMAIENIWDSQTDRAEIERADAFRIRANCVEDFDINNIYLDTRTANHQENSPAKGVKTGMGLYKFELDTARMKMSDPLDVGHATNPDNYPVYKISPPKQNHYPSTSALLNQFFSASENVMLANVTVGYTTASRLLTRRRIFTNAETAAEYKNLIGNLKLEEQEFFNESQDKLVKNRIANVFVWEDMQVSYYPTKGIDGLSIYSNNDNRLADQQSASATRLTELKIHEDGIGRKAPIGGWRYRFVWDYGNGDYSAPSTEMMCPDIMWSAAKDDDLALATRNISKEKIDDSLGKQAVNGVEWDKFKGGAKGFNNISTAYTLVNEINGEYFLTTMGKAIYDIKAVLYKDSLCKYGIRGTTGYRSNGAVTYDIPTSPWESYNAGDFCANVMLKAPEHVIDLKGLIAEFAAFDVDGQSVEENIENVYVIPKDFQHKTIHALFAAFGLSVPTFPYSSPVTDYRPFERFAYMNGIFDYHGRYRLSYKNPRSPHNIFILMPSVSDPVDMDDNTCTDNYSVYFMRGNRYYGVFQSVKSNHASKFYLSVEAGLAEPIDGGTSSFLDTDAHNREIIRRGTTVEKVYNRKPETLLRAYWSDADSPVIVNSDIPNEVTQRLLLSGHAELEILKNGDTVPLVPHIEHSYGNSNQIIPNYEWIEEVDKTHGHTLYGWEDSLPRGTKPVVAAQLRMNNLEQLQVGYSFKIPYYPITNVVKALPLNLNVIFTGRTIEIEHNGVYAIKVFLIGEDTGAVDPDDPGDVPNPNPYYLYQIAQIDRIFDMTELMDYSVIATYDRTGYQGHLLKLNTPTESFVTKEKCWDESMFIEKAYYSDGSVFHWLNIEGESMSWISSQSLAPANSIAASVYLPGHRFTILEQLVSIFPSGLLHKSPRVAVKVPNRFVPKKAKRLLIYRTLNSMSNEYSPTSYGLVKAIEIRRATGYDSTLSIEEDTKTGIKCFTQSSPTQDVFLKVGDAITSEYIRSEFILGSFDYGGGELDFYKGIYFFDDVRDSMIDFSNNPDQYEALRYALKSAHNVSIGERVYYGNVIQQYQPEAPVAYNHSHHIHPYAIDNTNYMTCKAKGKGLGDKRQCVSYVYIFEDEMGIRSQPEMIPAFSLTDKSIDDINIGERRDVALFFIPGPYTNGIKKTIIYRKMFGINELPSDCTQKYLLEKHYYIGEIDNKIDAEGIFVDDGLPNGEELKVKAIYINSTNAPHHYVFDTPPNTEEYESGVFWSEPYRPDVIKMENFIEFGSGDGGSITGMESQYGNIVIFKDSSIYRSAVQTENPPISRVDMVSRYEGCIAPNTLLNVEDTMYFLSSSGFMKYDNNVIKAADNTFHEELMAILKSNEGYNIEASAGYNQHFKEIYLNIPRVVPIVTIREITDNANAYQIEKGQYRVLDIEKVIVDTNDFEYYETKEVQGQEPEGEFDTGPKPRVKQGMIRREHYGHIFVLNEQYQYTTKFGYPSTSFKMFADNSSYFPIFVYHPLHLMRKYYTGERGVLYSADIIPHWYGAGDTAGAVDSEDEAERHDKYSPVLWAGVYSESPSYGDTAMAYVDTNHAFGGIEYGNRPVAEMDMILDHRALNEWERRHPYSSYPFRDIFPKIDSIEINSVYKSKFYSDGSETTIKRLRSAGVNIFSKNAIKILYAEYPIESIDSGIRTTPLPEILVSTNNLSMEYGLTQLRYNYPPTIDSYNKWSKVVTEGTKQNILYFIPDTRMAYSRYKGKVVPYNDDAYKFTKFSIEIYSQGRMQLNALTYHTRNIWSYLR